MMKSNCTCTVAQSGTTLTVRLRGEMDHHSALSLRSTIDGELFRRRPTLLRLDLSGIQFMDSSGLGLIMGRLNLLRELQGELILCAPSSGVRRILELSGMDRLLKIDDTAPEDAPAPDESAAPAPSSSEPSQRECDLLGLIKEDLS